VSGPTATRRNPLYLGRFLILTGFCLMAYLPIPVGGIVITANLIVLAGQLRGLLLHITCRARSASRGARLAELHGGGAWRS
jgi:protein-S-isoprenylcysteine O-methyltransferase Ste14